MTNLTKILVVDDEPLLESLIMQKFKPQIESKTLAFYFASNGVEALKKLGEDKEIGVVLTDIKMHEMDGITLLHHLSNQPRLYKIVVVSAYGDMSNIRKSMEEGASDFILKPFDLRDLEASLTNVVNLYQFVKRGLESRNKVIELEKELQIARDIKRAFIPTDFPTFDNVKVAGEMIFSSAPGGDFFDFFTLSKHQIGIVVASFNSQGIPAALNTAILQMLFRAKCIEDEGVKDSIQDIHQFVLDEMPSNTLSGLFYAVCDTVSGEVDYYNTGKVLPFLISSGRLVDIKDEGKIQLKDSDKIFITTREGEFGSETIRSILESSNALDASDLVKKLHANFLQFAENSPLSGDIPLFCLEKYKGAP
jgi:sigma-B regulation protein RsbU (phosphoserine phosphatase)